MTADSQAAIIVNDLDSLVHRIEALPAHPEYTKALNAVIEAREAVRHGWADLHVRGMQERFAEMDGVNIRAQRPV